MSAPKFATDTWAIAAGGVLQISRPGDFFKCMSATARFKISFDRGAETDFRQGLELRPQGGYKFIQIRNTNDFPISVELAFGEGELSDNSLILEGEIPVKNVSPSEISTPAPVNLGAGTTGQLVAANSARSEVLIKNLSTTERVWVQGVAVAAAEGFPLDGKEGLVLTTSAAVHAYNPSGVAIDVAILETVKSS